MLHWLFYLLFYFMCLFHQNCFVDLFYVRISSELLRWFVLCAYFIRISSLICLCAYFVRIATLIVYVLISSELLRWFVLCAYFIRIATLICLCVYFIRIATLICFMCVFHQNCYVDLFMCVFHQNCYVDLFYVRISSELLRWLFICVFNQNCYIDCFICYLRIIRLHDNRQWMWIYLVIVLIVFRRMCWRNYQTFVMICWLC